MINLPSGTTISKLKKTYHAALRTYEIKSPGEVFLVIFFRPLCINKILFFIIINSFISTVTIVSLNTFQTKHIYRFDIFDKLNRTLDVNRCWVFNIFTAHQDLTFTTLI